MKANKNKAKSDTLPPKIQTYFKAAPKSFVVEDGSQDFILDSDAVAKEGYIEDLKKKLQDVKSKHAEYRESASTNENGLNQQQDGAEALIKKNAEYTSSKKSQINFDGDDTQTSGECTGCIQKASSYIEKVNECEEWERKYKEIKKVYLKLTINYSEVNSKYNDLLKTVTTTDHRYNKSFETPTDDLFIKSEVRVLQGMSLDQDKDATFIRECLQYVYKADWSILKNKTRLGTPEWIQITENGENMHHASKDPLTPEKVNRIKALFTERISKCPINSAAFAERIKPAYVHKLIASGINNIAKKCE